ncbi:hypothetical protein KIH74_35625, partial [Kineosporia sp. J2-2]
MPESLPGSDLSARIPIGEAGASWLPEYDATLADPTRGIQVAVNGHFTESVDWHAAPLLPAAEMHQVLIADAKNLPNRAGGALFRLLERVHHRRGEFGPRAQRSMSNAWKKDALRWELRQLKAGGDPDPLSRLLDDLADRPEPIPDPAVVEQYLEAPEPVTSRARLATLERIRWALVSRLGHETPNALSTARGEQLREVVLDALGIAAGAAGSGHRAVLTEILRVAAVQGMAFVAEGGGQYQARVIDVGDVRLVRIRIRIHFVADSDVTDEQARRTADMERRDIPTLFNAIGSFDSRGRTVFLRLYPVVTFGRRSRPGVQNIRLSSGFGIADATRVYTGSNEKTLLHETLHALGLRDRYAVEPGVPRPLFYEERRLRPGNPAGPTHFRPNALDAVPTIMSSASTDV